jgi:hypothetical protein
MSHFAKVVDGKVIRVIRAEPSYIKNLIEEEPGDWYQTSINTRGGVHYDPNTNEPSADQTKAIRYNFAGLGHNYDYIGDAFYGPQPFPSWILNKETYTWEAPVDYPNDGNFYFWNETLENWEPPSSEYTGEE